VIGDLGNKMYGKKPQDKFVYIRWLWLTQHESYQGMSTTKLANALQLNPQMIRRSVRRLCEGGEVIMLDPLNNSREKTYKLKSQNDPLVNIHGAKKSYIQSLLGLNEDLEKCRAEALAKRLLKAVLVALSKEIGLVEDVGLTGLAKVTGLSIQRIRRYKDELLAEGFVLKFISGCNAPNVYPKCKSIIILDPSHFGGGLLRINNFPEEKLLGVNVNETIKKATNKRYRANYRLILEQEIKEINRHYQEERIQVNFDELVSQYTAENKTIQGRQLKTHMLAKSNSTLLNETLKSSCDFCLNTYSAFIVRMMTCLNIEQCFTSQVIEFYYFRCDGDFIIISNANKSYSGEIKWINRVDVEFEGQGVSWRLDG
jgi:uncharacterized membrane protein YheB (UPF0754 family)